MADKRGIDISAYQGSPDFAKLKGKVDFIILRAGYGRYPSQKDKSFERNYAECRRLGIPVGAYWFSYAVNAADAKREAAACAEVLRGKKFEYPIYFDVEGKSLVDKATVSAMCETFCSAMEKQGWFAGIYISRSPAQTMLTEKVASRYALWLAEYGGRLNWSGDVGMWQNSSSGKVSGISGNVDTDICYVDYPKLIRAKGLNGFKADGKPVLDNVGFRKGDRSEGVLAYKLMLKLADEAGVVSAAVDENNTFGEGTLKATNALLAKWGYAENGIAGEGVLKRLYSILKR
ncbi:Glycosyl hydrolases family 25 [Ruminococcus sp. YE71]|uniref:glycoside hydrolase family 25 protein n=1 Tax=unclassified Ruminococcus TaxID=2608920 RepID=UPI00088872EF|nr:MULTISPECIES: glycoside hydrolase family 25 protein [unclassified Ruminococcus]SDA10226.1 Glycosyl hydrolases family 25 [Ruminococcus sp. YE78]SFW10971.1 Glycosyl hydrolases family 25 [Ruminococcus sp. YE71]